MILDPNSMPPLVRDFALAVRSSPSDQAWLRQHGHEWIDSLLEPDGESAAMAQEILRLMRENLLGDTCWGSLIWDHDLVPKVIEATGLSGEAREQLALVASWDGVCNYVFEHLDGATAQSRALWLHRAHSRSGSPCRGVRAGGLGVTQLRITP